MNERKNEANYFNFNQLWLALKYNKVMKDGKIHSWKSKDNLVDTSKA
jgi:hypothetical protein